MTDPVASLWPRPAAAHQLRRWAIHRNYREELARIQAQRADLKRTSEIVALLHEVQGPCPGHHQTVLHTYPHPAGPEHGMAAGIACLLRPKEPTP